LNNIQGSFLKKEDRETLGLRVISLLKSFAEINNIEQIFSKKLDYNAYNLTDHFNKRTENKIIIPNRNVRVDFSMKEKKGVFVAEDTFKTLL
jgi:hypothetical protein